MARIPMTNGFQLIPEGEYVFRIYDATFDDNFGKVVIKMVTAKGQMHTERFSLKGKNGEWNDKALGAFSYFAKTALNDFDREDIDVDELVGCYIRGEIVHSEIPSNKDMNKTLTFANLGSNKESADGFDEAPSARVVSMFKDIDGASSPAPATSGGSYDLDSILND